MKELIDDEVSDVEEFIREEVERRLRELESQDEETTGLLSASPTTRIFQDDDDGETLKEHEEHKKDVRP